MNIRSETAASYRVVHIVEAVIWFACAVISSVILVMVIRTPEKNAWQYCLIVLLGALTLVFVYNALRLLGQNFKSLEVTDRGETILLKQFGKTTVLHPDEITQVRLEEKYLLYSFSTKPKEMLVIEAPGVLWQIRSDSITYYDRVINYLMEQEEDDSM